MSEIGGDLIAEAITEQFGERCPDFDADCYCCKVWKQYDDLRAAKQWQPIETAPKDGTRFWGNVDDDAIAMLWHEGFGEFVSSWRRMEMAGGYTIDGASYKDHSPVIHKPTYWMPIPAHPITPDEVKLRRSKALDELGALDGELI